MATSQAKIDANRRNAEKSTGPRTEEGKANSRRNALKHGMTGDGIVVPVEDMVEVEKRFKAYVEDLQPKGALQLTLVRRAATLAVRMERCAEREIESRVDRVTSELDSCEIPDDLPDDAIPELQRIIACEAAFDASREGKLVRRYELDAERGFYRAIMELRRAQNNASLRYSHYSVTRYQDELASFLKPSMFAKSVEARFPELMPDYPHPAREAILSRLEETQNKRVDVPITIGKKK